MKLVAIAATAAAISLVLPAPSSHAQAQQARSSPDQQQSQPSQADIPITPAATLVGRDVMGAHGNNAGRVNSIVLDMQNGAVEYVLIEGRDDFDLKGALAAVPWSGLQPPQPQGNITLKISADQLRQSPRINPDIVYELNTPGWRSRIYGYYGYPYPYYYGRRGAYSWYGAYPEGRYGEAHWPAQDQSINGPDKAAQQGNTAQSATQSRHGGDSNSQSGNSSSRESAQSAAQS
ncbi:MAG: PRC-barrel domain-containing protein, partial [bacterium]